MKKVGKVLRRLAVCLLALVLWPTVIFPGFLLILLVGIPWFLSTDEAAWAATSWMEESERWLRKLRGDEEEGVGQ